MEKSIRKASHKFRQARLDLPRFPQKCPYTVEQLLDIEYLPGEEKW
ncbi:MAG: hypothetical protein ACFB4I_15425 [Cyanophyceae cyanobacterium]